MKDNPKPKKPKTYYLRHVVFFAFVLVAALLIKENTLFKDLFQIKVRRRQSIIANTKKADKVFKAIVSILGEEKCKRDEETLFKYSRDRSHHPRGNPTMITFPETVEDVQTIVRICDKYNHIVIPMGLNSGLEGQTIAYHGGVIVNMMKMKKIVHVYEDDLQAVVEPGLRVLEINEKLKPYGLFFPLEPASNPSIGGAVNTGASGTLTPKFQTARENVVSLEVVLPNGKLINTRARSIKSSAGYDLTNIFIGSEGTLGIVTKVTIKLHKIPKIITSAVVKFNSLKDAADTVIGIKGANINGIARLEIVNAEAIKTFNSFFGVDKDTKPSLFVEYHGNSENEVNSDALLTKEIANKHGGMDFQFSSNEDERKELWSIRNKAYFAASKSHKKGKECKHCRLFSTDVCVPLSTYSQVITDTVQDFKDHKFTDPIVVGHSGDGNFHALIPVDYDDEDEVKRMDDCYKRLVERAIAAGGTCTGEHGVGVGKMDALLMEFGEEAVDVMRKIKFAIDPKGLMNPNKVFSRNR